MTHNLAESQRECNMEKPYHIWEKWRKFTEVRNIDRNWNQSLTTCPKLEANIIRFAQ